MYAAIKQWIEYISSFDPSLVFKRKNKKQVDLLSGFATFGIDSLTPTNRPNFSKFAIDADTVGVRTNQRKLIRVVVDIYATNGLETLELLAESSDDLNVSTIFGDDAFLSTESIMDMSEIMVHEYPNWYQGIFVFASSPAHVRNIPRVRGIEITGEIDGNPQRILIGDIE